MDTDNLTEMAYRAIILADDAADIIKCELGVLCGKFKSDDEYLRGVLEYLDELDREPEGYLDSWGMPDDLNMLESINRARFRTIPERRRLACVGGRAAMTGWKPILQMSGVNYGCTH